MSSYKQRFANRQNAQLSTGPRTPEGKQHSSSNSLAHGLTASTIAQFPAELRDEFTAFRAQLEVELCPVSLNEQIYFEHYVFAQFLSLRGRAIELQLQQRAIANPLCEQSQKLWRNATRYTRSHIRAAAQALATLQQFQTNRLAAAQIQDIVAQKLNSDVVLPIALPLHKLVKPETLLLPAEDFALSFVFAQPKRQNEPISQSATY